MALAGTALALLAAFPLGFLAARNTTPHRLVYLSVRAVLNLVRTIPDLALGLLFVAAVGLGAFAGTLALAIHTATVLAKLLSESVENIDEGIVEAIRATGASYPQILSFAVVPQILPDLISFTLYRLETNIRAASVLGSHRRRRHRLLDELEFSHVSISGSGCHRARSDRPRHAGGLLEFALAQPGGLTAPRPRSILGRRA